MKTYTILDIEHRQTQYLILRTKQDNWGNTTESNGNQDEEEQERPNMGMTHGRN